MDLSGVTFDPANGLAVASLVLVGMAGLWAARRALGFAR